MKVTASDLDPGRTPRDLVILALLTPIVGAAAGLVGGLFRLVLLNADALRNRLVGEAQAFPLIGLLLVVTACALAGYAAAWLVRRYSPVASGSGIPHVEVVIEGRVPPAPFRLLPVKFVGGTLAIGSGFALGREGPTVQMGASLADLVGTICRRSWVDRRVLIAAGAGAGLATAFNAPIAGAIFVLEELVRRFEPRIAMVALGTSATAVSVSRLILGDAPDFTVQGLDYAEAGARPLFLVLGLLLGLFAIVYNRTLLATMSFVGGFKSAPAELRAAVIGAGIGALAFFYPDLVGGGDPLTQRALNGLDALALLPALILLRLVLGSLSYAAGTPGGLFAPMLVLGAQAGLAFGLVCQWAFPGLAIEPIGFAVVGMAALFTGIVRAPLTGIVLVIEMTASVTMLLPMLMACFAAMFVGIITRDPPVYESLRDRLLETAGKLGS
ncbi:MAG: H(+)/Cl(-) exchange transporter ClcA [Rhizobiales bacterium]|nr:H(+)/Cl(-) exchange transporter ClcA [Hyphomicrobiales bacterium]